MAKKNTWADTFFLMTIGLLLAWSMVGGIIDTTVFAQTHLLNLFRLAVILLVLRLIVLHKYLIFASFSAVLVGGTI